MVEDSGLYIRALNGFPGPYSSYVYKTIGYFGILKLMEDVTDRGAHFKSVVAFYDGNIYKIFIGTVYGEIINDARGYYGFGFDPIFKPEGSTRKTFAEMSLKEKCMYSHRAKSITKFCIWFNKLLG